MYVSQKNYVLKVISKILELQSNDSHSHSSWPLLSSLSNLFSFYSTPTFFSGKAEVYRRRRAEHTLRRLARHHPPARQGRQQLPGRVNPDGAVAAAADPFADPIDHAAAAAPWRMAKQLAWSAGSVYRGTHRRRRRNSWGRWTSPSLRDAALSRKIFPVAGNMASKIAKAIIYRGEL